MLLFGLRIAINAAALLLIAHLSNGEIIVRGWGPALLVALVLGVANATVKPILYAVSKAMTCALSCLTLGLWSLALSWLINGLLFWLAAKYLQGFGVRNDNFWIALWGALALSIVNVLATVFTRREKERD
jgi:putative membrane protein